MQKLTLRVSPFYLKLHVNHKRSCKPIVVTMVDAKMTEFAQSHVLRWMSPAMVTPCPAASDTVWVEENQSRTHLGAFSNLHHVFSRQVSFASDRSGAVARLMQTRRLLHCFNHEAPTATG